MLYIELVPQTTSSLSSLLIVRMTSLSIVVPSAINNATILGVVVVVPSVIDSATILGGVPSVINDVTLLK